MKPSSNSNSMEESSTKTAHSKNSKKSTKSRAKTSKTEDSKKTGTTSSNNNPLTSSSDNENHPTGQTVQPTTPQTTGTTMGNNHDSPSHVSGSNNSNNAESGGSGGSSRSHHKSYAVLDARSIKIFWEQHDESDVELQAGVCELMAEDASYKLWEVINTIKTYARHSGGTVTYDLVNEALRDVDVPPMLGARDTGWEHIQYDGNFYFYSDNIIELRDEYQKEISITMPTGPDFVCSWPVDEDSMKYIKQYIPCLTYVTIFGKKKALDVVLNEAACSPIIGSCYRVILGKLIQMLAFKQSDPVSARCWSLLRALIFNPYTRDADCREEYFHLAEILICQLLSPYETIKVHSAKPESMQAQNSETVETAKVEPDEISQEVPPTEKINEFTDQEKLDLKVGTAQQQQQEQQKQQEQQQEPQQQQEQQQEPQQEQQQQQPQTVGEKVFKLIPDDEEEEEEAKLHHEIESSRISSYFASPVDLQYVDVLCETIGQIAAANGFFQSECLFLVVRRLERFFEGRNISTEKEYNYISRVVRGLIHLGEYAFREFIPFIYKFDPDNVPANIWNDFAPAALFLHGRDDIFLYEWLECLCGADKLQPFLIYYAEYHDKMLTYRFLNRRRATYKISPKRGVRRLEWSTVAAAMCHGDDPNKAMKPKPTLNDYFPEIIEPNLKLNRAGTIRFKFSGCRPTIIKSKLVGLTSNQTETLSSADSKTTSLQKDILIARRKLYKSLTDERRIVPLSSYYYTRI